MWSGELHLRREVGGTVGGISTLTGGSVLGWKNGL
jgi:hypothetical protein